MQNLHVAKISENVVIGFSCTSHLNAGLAVLQPELLLYRDEHSIFLNDAAAEEIHDNITTSVIDLYSSLGLLLYLPP